MVTMIRDYLEHANFEDTGFSYTLSLISGKHKMVKKVSDKTLSQNLKELERDGLITRTVYPQIPPKVEYALTERGKSLVEVLDGLCTWGEKNRR